MRKGDQTRQQILRTAEELFCSRGYEETSVQDILDVLHGSKGGFYHHFVSKDDVLKTLCTMRADEAVERAQEALGGVPEPMDRLNLVLRYANPLRVDELTFMAMLLPLLRRAEGVPVRVTYQEALREAFQPLLEGEIAAAAQAGVIRPPVPDAARPVLLMLNACWQEAAGMMLEEIEQRRRHDSAALLGCLRTWRKGIEVLLDAPYGSVTLIELDSWDELAAKLAARLKAGAR